MNTENEVYTTPKTEEAPEIKWDRTKDALEAEMPGLGRKEYTAYGNDVYGNEYVGTAIWVDDILRDIDNIQMIDDSEEGESDDE